MTLCSAHQAYMAVSLVALGLAMASSTPSVKCGRRSGESLTYGETSCRNVNESPRKRRPGQDTKDALLDGA
eukprot:CAMPEP_0174715324 /NCGR_PEP_ID=MMETSP1094-20130205/21157_1 /TAXON_ID=156173 /ORGANISM="Chrysochromulina brevifilum, Strain UTEX LB 985" /LENGTH=70 /DNA_ID=CAMNT_0015914885 /DNA_START=316 /DNA_END=528 /DNA_ORIENTATION=+